MDFQPLESTDVLNIWINWAKRESELKILKWVKKAEYDLSQDDILKVYRETGKLLYRQSSQVFDIQDSLDRMIRDAQREQTMCSLYLRFIEVYPRTEPRPKFEDWIREKKLDLALKGKGKFNESTYIMTDLGMTKFELNILPNLDN